MMNSVAYRTNDAKAISEALEGEVMVINFQTGTYYNLNATAACIWQHLRAGVTLGQLEDAVAARYAAAPEVIHEALSRTLKTLLEESLIIECHAGTEAPPYAAEKEPFVEPAIEKYDDMQEMLLADPIHDVDAAGWPKLKPAALE